MQCYVIYLTTFWWPISLFMFLIFICHLNFLRYVTNSNDFVDKHKNWNDLFNHINNGVNNWNFGSMSSSKFKLCTKSSNVGDQRNSSIRCLQTPHTYTWIFDNTYISNKKWVSRRKIISVCIHNLCFRSMTSSKVKVCTKCSNVSDQRISSIECLQIIRTYTWISNKCRVLDNKVLSLRQ